MSEPSDLEPAKTLIFAWGNPSRGDDALGPILLERLEKLQLSDVELLSDFQLQVEHSLDLLGRERVLFIDASVSCRTPYAFTRLRAQRDNSFSTHALSPQALLDTYESVQKIRAPVAFMLSIRGYTFALGEALSERAEYNLAQACSFVRESLFKGDAPDWSKVAE